MSAAKLKNVRETRIPVAGEAKVRVVVDETQSAVSRFDIAEVARPLWSVGLLYDAGYDVIISHSMGTYIAHKDRPGTHIQMTRVKNSFGVRADRYANKRDACAAARSGTDSFRWRCHC